MESSDTTRKVVTVGRQVGFVFDSEDTDGFLSEARTRFDAVLLAWSWPTATPLILERVDRLRDQVYHLTSSVWPSLAVLVGSHGCDKVFCRVLTD